MAEKTETFKPLAGESWILEPLFDAPKDGVTNEKPWIFYTVKAYRGKAGWDSGVPEHQSTLWFVDKPTHNILQEAGVKRGIPFGLDVMQTRYTDSQGKDRLRNVYVIKWKGGEGRSDDKKYRQATTSQSQPSTASAPESKPRETLSDSVRLMSECIRGALTAFKNIEGDSLIGEYTVSMEDVRAIAVTLYIQASRAGITVPKDNVADVPPPPGDKDLQPDPDDNDLPF